MKSKVYMCLQWESYFISYAVYERKKTYTSIQKYSQMIPSTERHISRLNYSRESVLKPAISIENSGIIDW